MIAVFILFIAALCASLASAQPGVPPIYCETHVDCTSEGAFYAQPFGKIFALCERGKCASLIENKSCTTPAECGLVHSCMGGKCVLGGAGTTCRIDSEDCMPGFACNAATSKCVKGVAGTLCRTKDECGFGNSCYLELPIPKARAERRGICKPGKAFTFACRRDMHCTGNLKCFRRYNTPTQYFIHMCGVLADFSKTPYPNGFGACATDKMCLRGLSCIDGRCQPRNLGQPCALDLLYGNRQCSMYNICKNGRCVYPREGDECRSETASSYNDQCPPGLTCDAQRGVGLGKVGKCVKGVEGRRCFDGRECGPNLVCGSNGYCTRTVEGQRCFSSFFCPSGALCRRSTKKCTFKVLEVPESDRFPEVERAKKCKWINDCGENVPCINGICLPRSLAWVCKTSPQYYGGTSCVNGIEVEGILGKPCASTDNCFFGLTCAAGMCQKSGSGSSCSKDYNCPDGYTCNSVNSLCYKPKRGELCRAHADCSNGQSCIKSLNLQLLNGRCAFR